MSIAEIDRFAADVKSNAALRAAAEKTEAGSVEVDGVQAMPMAAVVSFAVRQGYSFTVEEVMERATAAKGRSASKHLTDAELDDVAGGVGQLDVQFQSPTWTSDASAVFVSLDEDTDSLGSGAGNEGNHAAMVVIPNQAAMGNGMKAGHLAVENEHNHSSLMRTIEIALGSEPTRRSD